MERSERKILVVDDEPIICNLMRTAFSRAGYSIVAADSGAEALAAVNLSAFDLMFIDLNLRDMNGIDLFRAVRRLRPESVAYLMTGYASEADLIRCRRAEFADCLVKPVALSALVGIARAAATAAGELRGWGTGGFAIPPAVQAFS